VKTDGKATGRAEDHLEQGSTTSQTGATAYFQKRSVWRETDMSGRDSPASTTHTSQEFTEKEEEE